MDTPTVDDIKISRDMEQLKELDKWDQIMVPGLFPSMSMTNLESSISGQPPGNLTLSSNDWQSLQILDHINRCLFMDSQVLPDPTDDKSLMSRVNSLCCLLHKDTNNPPTSEHQHDNKKAKIDGGVAAEPAEDSLSASILV